MKLIGLGLAVGFTEKLMPIFEKVAEWVMNEGIPAFRNFGKGIEDAFKEGGAFGVADMLLDKFDEIDWNEISTILIDGVNSIDWAQAGLDFSNFVTRVSESISTAFGEFDWLGLGNSLASALNNFIAGMFGTDEAGMQAIIQQKLAETQTAFTDWANGMPSSLDPLDAGINAKITDAFTKMKATISTWIAGVNAAVDTWAAGIQEKYQTWADGVNATVDTAMETLKTNISTALNTLKTDIENKLTDIAKMFFNRAAGWGNQMLQGFVGSQGALFSSISGMVQEINGLLRQIITSFHLTLTYSEPTSSGGMGGGNRPRPSGGGGGNSNSTPYASGGSFVVPARYGNEGFGMGGIATASAGERVTITPRGGQQQQQVVTIDEARLARTIVQALMQAGFAG